MDWICDPSIQWATSQQSITTNNNSDECQRDMLRKRRWSQKVTYYIALIQEADDKTLAILSAF